MHTSLISRWRRTGGSSLLALAGVACAAPPPAATAPTSGQLWQLIEAEVGDASCVRAEQCHSIAVGVKACGGPAGFLAWSSNHADAARLAGLVARHAEAAKAEQTRAGRLSDCMLVTDPGVQCVAGRCQLRPSSSAPARPGQPDA